MRAQCCIITALGHRLTAGRGPSPRCLLLGGRGQGPGLRASAGTCPLAAPGDLKEQNWSISFHKTHPTQIPAWKSLPLPLSVSSLALSFQKNIFPSLFFSVSLPEPICFVSCWAFTTGRFPHQSERRLNKHQQQMSEGACE